MQNSNPPACSSDPVEDTPSSACFLPVAQSLARKLEEADDDDDVSYRSVSEPSDDLCDRRYSNFSQTSIPDCDLRRRPRHRQWNSFFRPPQQSPPSRQNTPPAHLSSLASSPPQPRPSKHLLCQPHPSVDQNSGRDRASFSQPSPLPILRHRPLDPLPPEQISTSVNLSKSYSGPQTLHPHPQKHSHSKQQLCHQLQQQPQQFPLPHHYQRRVTDQPHSTASLPRLTSHYNRLHSRSQSSRTSTFHPRLEFDSLPIDNTPMSYSSPQVVIDSPSRPRPIRPTMPPPPARNRISSLWNLLRGRTLSRRPRRRATTPAPSAQSPGQQKRDWMAESFRMLRRSTNLSVEDMSAIPPAASANASATASVTASRSPSTSVTASSPVPLHAPGSTQQAPYSPPQPSSPSLSTSMPASRTRNGLQPPRYGRRSRSSNTSCSSATADAPIVLQLMSQKGGKATTDTTNGKLPVLATTRHLVYADAKGSNSFAGFRGRYVITTDGSSVSSCSDREDEAVNTVDAQHLFLSRKQLKTMQLK